MGEKAKIAAGEAEKSSVPVGVIFRGILFQYGRDNGKDLHFRLHQREKQQNVIGVIYNLHFAGNLDTFFEF